MSISVLEWRESTKSTVGTCREVIRASFTATIPKGEKNDSKFQTSVVIVKGVLVYLVLKLFSIVLNKTAGRLEFRRCVNWMTSTSFSFGIYMLLVSLDQKYGDNQSINRIVADTKNRMHKLLTTFLIDENSK